MGVAKCNDVYARVYVCFQSGQSVILIALI